MAMKPETILRVRTAFEVLEILLDRTPTQKEVARAAPATSATVSALWLDLTCDEEDDDPRPVQVAARRPCLGCRRPFPSLSAGHRVCPRCRGLDAWRDGIIEYVAASF